MPYSLYNIVDLILEKAANSGRSDRDISTAALGHESALRSLKRGNDPRLATIIALAEELRIDLNLWEGEANDIGNNLSVAWFGYVAAGGGDLPTDGRAMIAEDSPEGVVAAPIEVTAEGVNKFGGMAALTVQGNSMTPTYHDGDTVYIYFNDPKSCQPEKLIGRDCVVSIDSDNGDDSAVYLKRIRRSDSGKAGLFNLESLNSQWPTMTDQRLHNIMPVRYIRKGV